MHMGPTVQAPSVIWHTCDVHAFIAASMLTSVRSVFFSKRGTQTRHASLVLCCAQVTKSILLSAGNGAHLTKFMACRVGSNPSDTRRFRDVGVRK